MFYAADFGWMGGEKMEQIEIKDLHFSYPLSQREALKGINLSVRAGEYIVLCGESGCGKTTLLRHLKASLLPEGTRTGEVLYDGRNTAELSLREESTEIGYVGQNPENAVVTDKVFHELSFGAENLGLPVQQMRLRVAEIASYFGIGGWFREKTENLSGGQLQLLNLASVMVMHPNVLLLDEPTSQLDPIAATTFLSTIDRIHKELGMTVILTEHRLEEVLPVADRVVVMQKGEIVADTTPRSLGENLDGALSFVRKAMPTAMRIYAGVPNGLSCPLTVCEGKQWLSELLRDKTIHESNIKTPDEKTGETAVSLRDVYLRYEKDAPDVLRGLTLDIPKGCIFSLLGENGAGKSTALKVAAGLLNPYHGKVEIFGKNIKKIPNGELYRGTVGVLPQNVCTLFTEKTVQAELESICPDFRKTAEQMEISHLLTCHPYDISGGEQQRVALAKVLLRNPKILFLDEPTKGMDCAYKESFAKILRALRDSGITIVMVSHDVEFCAKYADKCAMVFDGEIASCAQTRKFFSDNTFYTTAANRMARHLFPDAVTDEDVMRLCRENLS